MYGGALGNDYVAYCSFFFFFSLKQVVPVSEILLARMKKPSRVRVTLLKDRGSEERSILSTRLLPSRNLMYDAVS